MTNVVTKTTYTKFEFIQKFIVLRVRSCNMRKNLLHRRSDDEFSIRAILFSYKLRLLINVYALIFGNQRKSPILVYLSDKTKIILLSEACLLTYFHSIRHSWADVQLLRVIASNGVL